MQFYCLTDVIGGFLPNSDEVLVLLMFCLQAASIGFLSFFDLQQRVFNNVRFLWRHLNICDSQGGAALGGVSETDILDFIGYICRGVILEDFVNFRNKIPDTTFFKCLVDKPDFFGQNIIKYRPPDGRIQQILFRRAQPFGFFRIGIPTLHHQLNARVQAHLPQLISEDNFVNIGKRSAVAFFWPGGLHGQVIDTQDHVLSGGNNRFAAGRLEQVLAGKHILAGFQNRFIRQRNVDSHLVAVKVRVKSSRHQWMQLNRAALNQDGFKCLNTEPVQGRRAV